MKVAPGSKILKARSSANDRAPSSLLYYGDGVTPVTPSPQFRSVPLLVDARAARNWDEAH